MISIHAAQHCELVRTSGVSRPLLRAPSGLGSNHQGSLALLLLMHISSMYEPLAFMMPDAERCLLLRDVNRDLEEACCYFAGLGFRI